MTDLMEYGEPPDRRSGVAVDLQSYGACPLGLTIEELETLLGPTIERFWDWMYGQTMAICEGRRYNHETKEHEDDECAEHPHGLVVYRSDVERYLAGLPVVD